METSLVFSISYLLNLPYHIIQEKKQIVKVEPLWQDELAMDNEQSIKDQKRELKHTKHNIIKQIILKLHRLRAMTFEKALQ